MRLLRRTASVLAGGAMLAVSAIGLCGGGASAGTVLSLGTTAGIANEPGLGADGLSASRTLFERPSGLATDSAGDVYVADAAAHVVREIGPDGTTHLVAGVPGAAGSDADGRTATSSHLVSPTGLLVVPAGLLIADPGAHRVVLLHAGSITAWAGSGAAGAPAAGTTAGSAARSAFRAPTGLADDGAGTVYVSDAGDDTVWSVSGQGVLTRVAGLSGDAGYTRSGDPATGSPLSDPTGLAWSSGRLFVADTGNQRLRTVSGGRLVDVVGPPVLTSPTGLDAGSGGRLFLTDAAGRVGLVSGSTVSWYTAPSRSGYSPDGTLAAQAGLTDPTALVVASDGRLLIAEAGTAAVRDLRVAAGPPHQPAAPTATVGDRYLDVSWRPVDDGGSPVTTWTVRAYAGGELEATTNVAGNRFGARLADLVDGRAYTVTVTATNASGASPESPASASLVPSVVDRTATGSVSVSGGGVLVFPGSNAAPTAGATHSAAAPAAPAVTHYLYLAGPGSGEEPPLSVPAAIGAPGAAASRGPATRPVARPLPTATPPVEEGALAPVESVPLLPVRSFADAATDVATVGKKSVVPLVLVGLLGAFLVLQGAVDRRDPTLAQAPLHADRGLEFGPA